MAADGSRAAAAEDRACAVSTRAEVEEALDQNALVMARLQRELDRRKSTFEGDLKRVLVFVPHGNGGAMALAHSSLLVGQGDPGGQSWLLWPWPQCHSRD